MDEAKKLCQFQRWQIIGLAFEEGGYCGRGGRFINVVKVCSSTTTCCIIFARGTVDVINKFLLGFRFIGAPKAVEISKFIQWLNDPCSIKHFCIYSILDLWLILQIIIAENAIEHTQFHIYIDVHYPVVAILVCTYVSSTTFYSTDILLKVLVLKLSWGMFLGEIHPKIQDSPGRKGTHQNIFKYIQ